VKVGDNKKREIIKIRLEKGRGKEEKVRNGQRIS
jgi:hypothetical protein